MDKTNFLSKEVKYKTPLYYSWWQMNLDSPSLPSIFYSVIKPCCFPLKYLLYLSLLFQVLALVSMPYHMIISAKGGSSILTSQPPLWDSSPQTHHMSRPGAARTPLSLGHLQGAYSIMLTWETGDVCPSRNQLPAVWIRPSMSQSTPKGVPQSGQSPPNKWHY